MANLEHHCSFRQSVCTVADAPRKRVHVVIRYMHLERHWPAWGSNIESTQPGHTPHGQLIGPTPAPPLSTQPSRWIRCCRY